MRIILRVAAGILGITALVEFSEGAGAVSAEATADARCVVIGARKFASSNPSQSLLGEKLVIYFVGRIRGRSPEARMDTLIEREGVAVKKMTESDIDSTASKCIAELSAAGAEISKIGKKLSKQ
jgi:hypothetical protein